jgi:hypothetical protein
MGEAEIFGRLPDTGRCVEGIEQDGRFITTDQVFQRFTAIFDRTRAAAVTKTRCFIAWPDRLCLNGIAITQYRGSFDSIFQLSNVTRPAVIIQLGHGVPTDGLPFLAKFAIELPEKVSGQKRDIHQPLPEWRDLHGQYINAIKQILPKPVFQHHIAKILIGGGDYPCIDGDFLEAADAPDQAILQYPKDFGLGTGRHIADLIEEDGSVACRLEQAGFAFFSRPGEGAVYIAEQLAFDKLLGQRRTVDGDERARPAAFKMQGPGKQLLAGAALTGNLYDCPGVGNLPGKGDDIVQRRALAEKIIEGYRQRGRDGIDHLFHLFQVVDEQHGPDEVAVGVVNRLGRTIELDSAGTGDDRFSSADGDPFVDAVEQDRVLGTDFADMLADDVLVGQAQGAAGDVVDGIDDPGGINGNNPLAHAVEKGAKPSLPPLLRQKPQLRLAVNPRQSGKKTKQGRLVKTMFLLLYFDGNLGKTVLLLDLHGNNIQALFAHQPGDIKDNADPVLKEQLKLQISAHTFPSWLKSR